MHPIKPYKNKSLYEIASDQKDGAGGVQNIVKFLNKNWRMLIFLKEFSKT